MLGYILSFFKSLNSNQKPSQIANSFCIGMILGFMPKTNLLWYMLFIFFAFVRINKACYYIMIAIGMCLGFLLDPLFDSVGYWFLTLEPLQGFFAFLMDIPFVGFTRFNNTIVTGSLLCGLLFYLPLFFGIFYGIKAWRKYVAPKLVDSKFVKAFYKLPLINKIVKVLSEVV